MHLDEKCCIKKGCRKDSKKHFCIKDSKYAKELIKLDFPANLYTSPTNCEKLLKHCNKYNMKFLKDSYGTIVHKQFNDYFRESTACGKYEKLRGMVEISVKTGIHFNHTNMFESKSNPDVHMFTSSPFNSLSTDVLDMFKNYPYDIYVIHPNFLDYHGFIYRFSSMRHPLWDVNYMFTDASEDEIWEIDRKICNTIDDDIFPVFVKIHGGDD